MVGMLQARATRPVAASEHVSTADLFPCNDWAEAVVLDAAFIHAVTEACRGWTMASSGRARCGACGWHLSARMGDVGTAGSARFAFAALARVGSAVELAWRSPR